MILKYCEAVRLAAVATVMLSGLLDSPQMRIESITSGQLDFRKTVFLHHLAHNVNKQSVI
jgi:hypothetical protein